MNYMKQQKKAMEDMSNSSSSSSGRRNQKEEEIETLKRRISSHPLYGLLLENHTDCLKVGSILSAERDPEMNSDKKHYTKPSTSMHSSSELDLDQFMETYCWALRELKEAIKEPQQETLEFINSMYSQLKELTVTNPPPAPNSSSGNK